MNPIKFYICSRLENAEQVTAIAEVLKAAGHIHTYDWTQHGSVQNEGADRIKQVAELEKQGVAEAELVIVILPGGRGTHAELGMAIALDKPVVICAESDEYFVQDDRTCAFYWNKNCTRIIGTSIKWVEEAMRMAIKIDRMNPGETL